MKFTKSDMDRFRKILDIPDFITPWLDRFYTDEEINLVLLLAEKPLGIAEISGRWTGDVQFREPDDSIQGTPYQPERYCGYRCHPEKHAKDGGDEKTIQ